MAFTSFLVSPNDELNDAENKLNDAQDKIDSGLAEIQSNEIKLQNSKNQIDQGWNEYYANLQLLDNIPTLQKVVSSHRTQPLLSINRAIY